ncbi:MAG: hypothetical protein FWD26_08270 [Treponema sp.]|nr:hypothetical protein [Treponema sp.]
MAIGIGLEMNMNSPEYFAGGVSLNFDYNLPIPVFSFSAGANITFSNNFAGISLLEFSGMFRWYFLSKEHKGWFVQINLGSNYSGIEGAPIALVSELRGGIRILLGNFYIEPYGRVGYPVVWGVGFIGGIRLPWAKNNNGDDMILRR